MARRYPRKVRPNKRYEGYDSKWEHDLHKGFLKGWDFHSEKIKYWVERAYNPDFLREFDGKKILLETKGRFWDSAEYSKYVWLAKVLPDDVELVFLFYNPALPMPRAKRRADGTKRSHAEWAEKNGFRWFAEYNFPEEWKNE